MGVAVSVGGWPCRAVVVTMAMLALVAARPLGTPTRPATLEGTVESAGIGRGGYAVTLYTTRSQPAAFDAATPGAFRSRHGSPAPQRLARAVTDRNGGFALTFVEPRSEDSILYLVAESRPVALATVLGPPSLVPESVVVNERTTVASGFALAQFIHPQGIAGSTVGLRNAAAMLRNLVDVETGAVGSVLGTAPNGLETSTLRTFNSLANMVAGCVEAEHRCSELLRAATSMKGRPASDTLDAMANIAGFPGNAVERLFAVAQAGPTPYEPALRNPPDAWTLALRFEGEGEVINGPGNFAVDAEGSLWVTNNYQPGGRLDSVCAGQTLLRFQPDGAFYPGSPYSGGGLSGAGYGITVAPDGDVWVGNFGFQAPDCVGTPAEAPHNSVSEFAPDGSAVSPDIVGYTEGKISWPQGTVSDQAGNIWIANCGNDSVTLYPGGDPGSAESIDLAPLGLVRPFDIAIDHESRAWVTGNGSDSVVVLDQAGSPVLGSPLEDPGLARPMGIASDSRGNMWISNSGVVQVPCENNASKLPLREDGGSVTLLEVQGASLTPRTFEGGGLAVPWGIAVDGNDTVWVANFGGGAGEGGSFLSRVSQLCGVQAANCPKGYETGDPISPETGYTSDALSRITGVAVDPSGTLWAVDNWQFVPLPNNPGGRAIVAFIGIAAPIATPLIGPPRPAR